MTGPDQNGSVVVDQLADSQLAAALNAGADDWSEQAAVDLLVSNGNWMGRWELRRAVEVVELGDGELLGWVDWQEIDMAAPASSGELRILELACSLGGVASPRPLSNLLVGLDDRNLARVLHAFRIASRGRNEAARVDERRYS